MAWSTPPTWGTGTVISNSKLVTLSDDLTFLHGPPKCRVYNSANISHATSTAFQALTFDSERYDTDTMHSTVSNTGRITFTTAGTYVVAGVISFAANATGNRGARIRLNGTTYIASQLTLAAGGGDVTDVCVSTQYAFSAGDYVELVGYQSSGGALNMLASGNYSPEFEAVWVSA